MKKNRRDKEKERADPGRLARRISTLFLIGAILVSCLVVGYVAIVMDHGQDGRAQAGDSKLRLDDIPFDGARAYEYLKQIAAIGPRRSGSAGMQKQQELLAAHFRKLGGQVEFQKFDIRHPVDGSKVPMANLIVRWHPGAQGADPAVHALRHAAAAAARPGQPAGAVRRGQRRRQRRGRADGAGARHARLQVALRRGLRALRRRGVHLQRRTSRSSAGRSTSPRSTAGSGSPTSTAGACCWTWWATRTCNIYEEVNSVSWPDTRPLVEEIWATARRWAFASSFPGRNTPSSTTTCRCTTRPASRPATSSTTTTRPAQPVPVAHPGRHGRAVFGAEPGQGGVGDRRVAQVAQVSP